MLNIVEKPHKLILVCITLFFLTYGSLNSGLVFSKHGVILIYAVGTTMLVIDFLRGRKTHTITKLNYIFLFAFTYLMLRFGLSITDSGGVSELNLILFTFFTLIISYNQSDNDSINDMLSSFVVFTVVAIIIGHYVIFFSDITLGPISVVYDLSFSKRMNSFFNNSTELGVFCSIGICFSIFLFQSKYYSGLVFGILFFILFYGCVLSGGRTGIFTTLIALFFMLFKPKNLSNYLIVTSAILLLSLLIYLNWDWLLENVFLFRRIVYGDVSGFGERGDKLAFFIDTIQNYTIIELLFGKGIGSVLNVLDFSIHSGVLREILELGLIVYVIFSLFTILIIVKSYAYSVFSDENKLIYRLVSCTLLILWASDFMIIALLGVSFFSILYIYMIVIYFRLNR